MIIPKGMHPFNKRLGFMYRLYIGSSISGETYPSLLSEGECLTGLKILDTSGFIDFLELHLGLKCEYATLPIQIEAYIQALTLAKKDAFYEKSLDADAYAVGKDLYNKRLELIESGLEITNIKNLPLRLLDLAKVEEHFLLKHSIADRTIKVRLFLENTIRLPRMSLTLLSPMSEFPLLFQDLFNLLKEKGVEIKINTVTEGNCSFKYIKVKNEFEASLVVRQIASSFPDSVTYIKSDSELVDLYGHVDGKESLGVKVSSRARPILQLIHLTSEFLWEPLDPCRVIEFLNLPIKPLNGKLAFRLSDALSESPGFGGKHWNEAISTYKESEEDTKLKEKNLTRLSFLIDRKRHEVTAPIKEIIELFEFLGQYLRDREFYLESDIVSSLIKLFTLMSKRRSELSKLELEKVLENNIPSIEFSERKKEIGSARIINSPENIIAPVERLVWYPFINMNSVIELSFWDKSERDYLHSIGVKLLAPFEKINLHMSQERNLLKRVQKEITLIALDTLNGELVAAHPLTNEIKFEIIDVENILAPLIEKNTHKQLPSQKGLWTIKNTALLKPRSEESYSSFEKLFYYPWLYLLDYQAKLSGRSVQSIEDDFRLRGNFAHAIFEVFFNIHKTPEEMIEPGKWFDNNFNKYVNENAIIWRQKGKETTLVEMHTQVRKALVGLCQHLVEDNWSVEEVEKKIEIEAFGEQFCGWIDMCLVRGDERCVLDLKYGGGKKYKNSLEQNSDLQLALYSKSYGEKSYAFTAYFIIASAQLYSKEIKAFKNPHNRPMASHHEKYDELWDQMENTHRVRREELGKGEIVVRDDVTQDLFEEKNITDDTYLNLKNVEGNKYHDFDVLLGFHRKNK